MHVRRSVSLLAVAAMVLALMPGLAGAAHLVTVAEGIDNPRGLAFVGDDLFVASAGIGAGGAASPACIPSPEDPDVDACYGDTGAILGIESATTLVAPAETLTVVVGGLPSLAEDGGAAAVGPHDVTLGPDGLLRFVVGLGADPAARGDLVAGGAAGAVDLGKVFAVAPDGSGLIEIVDAAGVEASDNPDGGDVDSNPFSVIADGDNLIVSDSGGNDLIAFGPETLTTPLVETTTVLPPSQMFAPPFFGAPPGTRVPADSVPTGITFGPPGPLQDDVFAGELTGFPFQIGAATVARLAADGTLSTFAGGFTNIIDIAWGPDGNLYVLEIAANSLLADEPVGALYRVSPDGSSRALLLDDLFFPGGIAFGPDGQAYISVCSICPGAGLGPGGPTGAVVRYDAVGATPILTIDDDTATTNEDAPVTIDVLANDSDGLDISLVPDNGNGAVVEGSIVYQPRAHFRGTDQVVYQACDGDGSCAQGVVTITVNDRPTDRIAGEDRFETAIRTSRAVFPDGADAVIVTRNDEYADALAGSVLARLIGAPVGAPILLTRTGELHPSTAAEINRLGATTAYVLGREAAVSPATEQAIVDSTTVTSTVRIGGEDRFETSALIKEAVEDLTGSDATQVFVAEGLDPDPLRGFPDVLSVSTLAAHQTRPILLVTTDNLPAFTADALSGVARATVIGGPVAVSQSVFDQIDARVGTVTRLAGADRYATSVEVAEASVAAGLDGSLLWLATGANWPDALTAAASVARDGGVLLLVHPSDLRSSPASQFYIAANDPYTDVDILGGPAAVGLLVESQVAAELN